LDLRIHPELGLRSGFEWGRTQKSAQGRQRTLPPVLPRLDEKSFTFEKSSCGAASIRPIYRLPDAGSADKAMERKGVRKNKALDGKIHRSMETASKAGFGRKNKVFTSTCLTGYTMRTEAAATLRDLLQVKTVL
jgi:hypothetical protein